MQNQPLIPIHFRKRFLAGSPLNTSHESAPTQESPLPITQLTPTANEVNVVADSFGLRNVKGRAKQKPEHKVPTPRQQFNLTRRDIIALLGIPGVDPVLNSSELRQYRGLATGNISEAELAKEIGMRDPVGVGVYIGDLETRIIRRALLLGVRLDQKARVETDTFDRTMDADRAADERDIDTKGGAPIGGSIISAGAGKALDSFEHGGKIRSVPGGAPDDDLTGGEVGEQDDYGEESSA
jgi:hypothetical protein